MTEGANGTVYLVGSGPGDPDLMTIKASRLLRKCDVLIYDSLVPQELLELVSASCICHFVGKRRSHHSVAQTTTNELLVEMAKKYKSIVRLKGGDPFLFGRGAEEAEYLIRHGIQVEVVPGVTAGIAVPAYLGIPVTHRLVGSSVTFVAGHETPEKKHPFVNWRALAKATDGLVIYMGVQNLHYITTELLAGGLDPLTPSAVIQQGTVIGQKLLKANLNTLADKALLYKFESPSIIMIGEIVKFQVEECAPIPANVTMPIPF